MSACRLTVLAEADLAAILAELTQGVRFFGDDAARHYCDSLKDELARLAAAPMNGRPEPAIDETTRSQPFRRHVIYYELDGDGILVLRVLPDDAAA